MRAHVAILLLLGAACGQDYEDYNQACQCADNKRCFCVEDFLCLPNNTISTQGAGFLNPRLDDEPVAACQDDWKCCEDTNADVEPPDVDGRCGVRGGTTAPTRVLGEGSDTEFGEFPWMLAIFRTPKGGGAPEMQCGASLITPNVALTAAHCVDDFKKDPSLLTVRAGDWDLNSTRESEPFQERAVAAIVAHPDYLRDTLRNDVALLVLRAEYEQRRNLGIICLPEQDATFEGRSCVATGWGRDVFGNKGLYQSVLRKVNLPVVAREKCQKLLRKTRLSRFFRLHESFICAGGETNTDTCEGDGGGPLVCEMDNGQYEQVGIVSWGIGCGQKELPGVYVGVAKFRDWIQEQVVSLERQSPGRRR